MTRHEPSRSSWTRARKCRSDGRGVAAGDGQRCAMNLVCATGSARGGRALQEQTRHSSYAITVRSSLPSEPAGVPPVARRKTQHTLRPPTDCKSSRKSPNRDVLHGCSTPLNLATHATDVPLTVGRPRTCNVKGSATSCCATTHPAAPSHDHGG
jgi:hypothetical protein